MPGFHFSMNRAALLAGTAFAGSNHSSVCVHGKILTRLVTSTSVVKNPACHSGYWKWSNQRRCSKPAPPPRAVLRDAKAPNKKRHFSSLPRGDTRDIHMTLDLPKMDASSLARKLPPILKETGEIHAIVETPKGSRNKFDFDPETGLFELGSAMPAGVEFPFEFGFIPGTLGEDGDPLDLLILMEAPTFVGCVVKARLIGVIEAKQKEKDSKEERNDRLIAVAVHSRRNQKVKSLAELPEELLVEIEHFFISYNELKEKEFVPLGRYGPKRALKLVKKGILRAEKSQQ
jgi:inorganic pyrophosphatase